MDMRPRSVAWAGVGVKRWGEELVDEVWAAMRSLAADLDPYWGYEHLTHQVHS
jgi:hypothetical protein